MSWSLKIRNGDLVLGGSSLGTVTSSDKLVQDLRCALLEPRGFESIDPDYGSTLDGGYVNGVYQNGVIGETDLSRIQSIVKGEIQRVAKHHQDLQYSRITDDRSKYGSSTLSGGELLIDVSDIDIYQIQDTLIVSVTLSVGNGTTTINVPIPGNVLN